MLGLALSLALTAQAGVPAIDAATTPSKQLDAPRAAPPSDNLCDEPVLLVLSGVTGTVDAYRRTALAGGPFRQLGGYELNAAKPTDALSGDTGSVQVVLRFPCRSNALAFWKASAPQPTLGAALYPELPLREDLVGKVGDNSYAAAFGAPTAP